MPGPSRPRARWFVPSGRADSPSATVVKGLGANLHRRVETRPRRHACRPKGTRVRRGRAAARDGGRTGGRLRALCSGAAKPVGLRLDERGRTGRRAVPLEPLTRAARRPDEVEGHDPSIRANSSPICSRSPESRSIGAALDAMTTCIGVHHSDDGTGSQITTHLRRRVIVGQGVIRVSGNAVAAKVDPSDLEASDRATGLRPIRDRRAATRHRAGTAVRSALAMRGTSQQVAHRRSASRLGSYPALMRRAGR